jgi:hypothetical protein
VATLTSRCHIHDHLSAVGDAVKTGRVTKSTPKGTPKKASSAPSNSFYGNNRETPDDDDQVMSGSDNESKFVPKFKAEASNEMEESEIAC